MPKQPKVTNGSGKNVMKEYYNNDDYTIPNLKTMYVYSIQHYSTNVHIHTYICIHTHFDMIPFCFLE